MTFSRRELLKSGAVLGGASMLPRVSLAAEKEKNPLYIPPLIDTYWGKPLFLSMEAFDSSFIPGKSVKAWGFNGHYLGPTIRVRTGRYLKFNYVNRLSQDVAIDLQGVQAEGEVLGGISRIIPAQTNWSPVVPIFQSSATCWYRSVMLGQSAYQVYRGLAGMLIIEDDVERKSQLPRNYGVNDFPLILQDMSFSREGEPTYTFNKTAFWGTRLLVNGVESPYVKIQKGWVRLRLVNASLSRDYHLRMDDDCPLRLIATGQGYLANPQDVEMLHLTPGERAEVLINMNEGDSASLINSSTATILDSILSIFDSSNKLENNVVLTMETEGLVSVFVQDISFSSQNIPNRNQLAQQVSRERKLTLDTDNALLNNQKIDVRRVDIQSQQGSVERWHIQTNSPTGFFIQGAKFAIESQNKQIFDEKLNSWRDTVWIDKEITILVKFDTPSSNAYPFIYGASNLCLADKGCLGLLVVKR